MWYIYVHILVNDRIMFFFTGPDPLPATAESPSSNAQSGLDQSLTDHSAVDKKHIYRKFSSKI